MEKKTNQKRKIQKSMNQAVEFNYERVADWWPLCFNNSCLAADKCMRHFAATHASADVTKHVCVTPMAKGYGKKCDWFKEKEIITLAYGFTTLFDQVRYKDGAALRQALIDYYHCKRQYYWHYHGERPTSPEQQTDMQEIMKQFGYDEPITFDRYEQAYKL